MTDAQIAHLIIVAGFFGSLGLGAIIGALCPINQKVEKVVEACLKFCTVAVLALAASMILPVLANPHAVFAFPPPWVSLPPMALFAALVGWAGVYSERKNNIFRPRKRPPPPPPSDYWPPHF